ncbi:putative DNA adenine methylase [Erwinia phage vB_EamM_Joad]|uniref:site-specific DNA-methyltransferase (adenine-specific) n=1 Tax=Erwinia phage vB_EamM_Joad TaxID=2026081 RepID=A0A223LIF5_9CAUD|nr:putative DNA adenine methylase [Erwinia phage vB_EamM_Joad]
MLRPYLKWVGGKTRVLDQLLPYVGSGKRLIEPFVGSGAVFLNTQFDEYVLSDNNKDLISLHTAVRDNVKRVIKDTQALFKHNNPEQYLKFRDEYNNSEDAYERAVLLLYLNRHSFNGLVRYNLKGVFNAAYGKYKSVYFPEEELLDFHRHSQNAVFLHQSFEETLATANDNDVVFCDPPYVPLNYTSNFTNYNKEPFNMTHQVELKCRLEELASKGIKVIATNSNNEVVKELYNGFSFVELDIMRLISCKGDTRQSVTELLMYK